MSEVSNEKKWIISFMSAVIFIAVASPDAFQFTNSILEPYLCINTIDEDEKPTWTGVLVHGIVFLLITRLIMNYKVDEALMDIYKTSSKSVVKLTDKVTDGFLSKRR